MRYFSFLFVIIFSLWGCHAKSSTSAKTDTPLQSQAPLKPLQKGVIIDSVLSTDDPTQIYAIYLPAKYDSTKKWPVIYFFDPHGVGNLPVTLYKDLAEKYGFIIAGTYNSQNGMAWENTEKAARAFIRDIHTRLAVDNNRQYTFGFSGGAIVASMVAISEGGIAGVVACGGSLPEDHPPLKHPFSYISFVGDKDFHYVSVKQLDGLLDSTSLSHQFIVFNGKHQWPPVITAEQAFQWFDADAMRMKTMVVNDSIVKSIQEKFLTEAENWHKKGNIVQEYYAYKKLTHFLQGLSNVSKYLDQIKQLENSATLKAYFRDEGALEQEESQEIADFRSHFSQMDQAWWDAKISAMEKRIARDTTSPGALQTERMLSYLSLVMYMGAINEFNSHDYQGAAYFVKLYAMVDPGNPEHSYLAACLAMTDHNSTQAIKMLQNAVKLGFIDSKRLQQDSNFVALRNSVEYKQLLEKIASKPVKPDITK